MFRLVKDIEVLKVKKNRPRVVDLKLKQMNEPYFRLRKSLSEA